MSHEKKGIIIVIGCCLVLLTMFLIQLPNEVEQTKSVDIENIPVMPSERFIPIQNVSYSPVNYTFYVVGGGGGSAGNMGYYPSVITK